MTPKNRHNESVGIWESVSHEEIVRNVPGGPLPESNRGSWYCPVADAEDVGNAIKIANRFDVRTVYDLGAGDLRFAVSLDHAGFNVVAYETFSELTDYTSSKLPENSVEVRNRDYYADWPEIRGNDALFLAIGKMNHIPDPKPDGPYIDGMEVKA